MSVLTEPKNSLHLLTRTDSVPGANNMGGKFSLPEEFDLAQWAGQWTAEGNDVVAAAGQQPVVGTNLTAPGWKPWEYPQKKTVIDQVKGVPTPKEVPHPKAGQQHKVTLPGKDGGTYVLLFRSRSIQDQVDLAYAMKSREVALNSRISAPPVSDADGLIPEEQMVHMGLRDREVEESLANLPGILGRAVIPSNGGRIQTESTTLSQ